MIKAGKGDKEVVITILSEAFDGNKSVNYIIPQDNQRKQRLRHLMAYAFDVCRAYGKVYLSDDKKGCALLLFPAQKKGSIKSILLDLKLVFRAIGLANLFKALDREKQFRRLHPKGPFYYLWFIGVAKDHQYRGIGKSLLLQIMKEARSKDLPLCLETSSIENLPWYKRADFTIYHVIDLGYRVYFLKRE